MCQVACRTQGLLVNDIATRRKGACICLPSPGLWHCHNSDACRVPRPRWRLLQQGAPPSRPPSPEPPWQPAHAILEVSMWLRSCVMHPVVQVCVCAHIRIMRVLTFCTCSWNQMQHCTKSSGRSSCSFMRFTRSLGCCRTSGGRPDLPSKSVIRDGGAADMLRCRVCPGSFGDK